MQAMWVTTDEDLSCIMTVEVLKARLLKKKTIIKKYIKIKTKYTLGVKYKH